MRRRIHVAASFGNTSCSMPGVCSIPPRTCERPRCYACHAVTGVTLLHAYWEALLYFSQSKVKRLALLHKVPPTGQGGRRLCRWLQSARCTLSRPSCPDPPPPPSSLACTATARNNPSE